MVGCLLYALVLHRHLSEAIKGVTVHTAAYGDRMIVCRPACEAQDTMARLQRSLSQIGIGIAEDSFRCYCSPHAGWSTRDMMPGNFVPEGARPRLVEVEWTMDGGPGFGACLGLPANQSSGYDECPESPPPPCTLQSHTAHDQP